MSPDREPGPEGEPEAAPPPSRPVTKRRWPRDRLYRDHKVLVRLDSRVEPMLGEVGRLLSGSKSGYLRAHPGHEVLFNACLFSEVGTQLWFGDIDLTIENGALQQVADELGEAVIVTPECPYRFDGLPPGGKLEARVRKYERRQRNEASEPESDGPAP